MVVSRNKFARRFLRARATGNGEQKTGDANRQPCSLDRRSLHFAALFFQFVRSVKRDSPLRACRGAWKLGGLARSLFWSWEVVHISTMRTQ